jgi:hypothetical protein
MKKSTVRITLKSSHRRPIIRSVNLGYYQNHKIVSLQKLGTWSALWKEITSYVSDQYPNDKLIAIESEGSIDYVEMVEWSPSQTIKTPCINLSGTPAVFS